MAVTRYCRHTTPTKETKKAQINKETQQQQKIQKT